MALICPLTHFYNINPKTKQLHRKERLIQPCVFSGGGTLCVLRQLIIVTKYLLRLDCCSISRKSYLNTMLIAGIFRMHPSLICSIHLKIVQPPSALLTRVLVLVSWYRPNIQDSRRGTFLNSFRSFDIAGGKFHRVSNSLYT